MKLEGKKVLVVGAGKSGIAASELLLDKKIETVLYDGNKDLDVEKLYEKAPKLKGMPVLFGELTDEQLREKTDEFRKRYEASFGPLPITL